VANSLKIAGNEMGKNRAAFFRGMDSISTEQSENWISKFEVNI
jgi:hypothetical protein